LAGESSLRRRSGTKRKGLPSVQAQVRAYVGGGSCVEEIPLSATTAPLSPSHTHGSTLKVGHSPIRWLAFSNSSPLTRRTGGLDFRRFTDPRQFPPPRGSRGGQAACHLSLSANPPGQLSRAPAPPQGAPRPETNTCEKITISLPTLPPAGHVQRCPQIPDISPIVSGIGPLRVIEATCTRRP